MRSYHLILGSLMSINPVSFRVYYEDTDAAGVMYHANYIKFAERARTEWLREKGVYQSELTEEEKVQLIVYHLDVKFLSPAVLDDLLTVETQLVEVKKASLRMEQTIKKDHKIFAKLIVSVACVNINKKPVGFPERVQRVLSI